MMKMMNQAKIGLTMVDGFETQTEINESENFWLAFELIFFALLSLFCSGLPPWIIESSSVFKTIFITLVITTTTV